MSDNKLSLPGTGGGLMRYDEEYSSKFMISPVQVIAYVVALIVFVVALNIFY